MKKIAIFVSSLTGNTLKIATAIEKWLQGKEYDVLMQDSKEMVKSLIIADYYILCFWCRKSSLDEYSKFLINQYDNTKFLVLGTLGNYPDSSYGNCVRENVTEYINQKNTCIDIFLCQGAISEISTYNRRRLPKEHLHHLDDEGYQRHLESRKHPNGEDIRQAILFVQSALNIN